MRALAAVMLRFIRFPFILKIVLPATAVFIAAAVSLTFALSEMANEVNRTEVSLTDRTTEAAVEATLRRIETSHRDYAVWDDAARKLYGEVDEEFVDDSFVSSTLNPVLFDTAYLVERSGALVFAYRSGKPVDKPIDQAFGHHIRQFIEDMSADGVTADVRSAIVQGAWGLAVVAVGPVVPFSDDFLPKPTSARFLIIARAFDADLVNQISKDYLIDGLKLSDAKVAAGTPLIDPDGKVLGALTWTAREPGTVALSRLTPRVAIALALLAAMLLALMALAARGYAKVRRGEALARHTATHDALSGLPNRHALVDHLDRAIGEIPMRGGHLAILYLDLDGFKEVNDSYGREVGDQLLRKVAKGFEALAGNHMLVRLGGDEFAVVVQDVDVATVSARLADRLIRFFARPFDVGGRIISISVSIGIAQVDEGNISVEEALRRADVAMYQAKQQGRNRVCAFDDSLDTLRLRRIEIGADLRRAMEKNGLTMFYQPVYDARTGAINSVEALVRWPRGDDRAPISPAEFIPIAEETGLIDELGAWTLHRACEDARAWPDLKVAVNVSPAQFQNPHFAEVVQNVLRDVGFAPDRLEIEITETYLITHPDQACRAIDAVRELGVTVALDDFGVGYSSIGYLRNFAFDKLKLDRSLIADIHRDPHAQKLIQATVALAGALSLRVTAEGVETEEEATLLRAAGCDLFQGYFFGRPVPAQEITALLGADARVRRAEAVLRFA